MNLKTLLRLMHEDQPGNVNLFLKYIQLQPADHQFDQEFFCRETVIDELVSLGCATQDIVEAAGKLHSNFIPCLKKHILKSSRLLEDALGKKLLDFVKYLYALEPACLYPATKNLFDPFKWTQEVPMITWLLDLGLVPSGAALTEFAYYGCFEVFKLLVERKINIFQADILCAVADGVHSKAHNGYTEGMKNAQHCELTTFLKKRMTPLQLRIAALKIEREHKGDEAYGYVELSLPSKKGNKEDVLRDLDTDVQQGNFRRRKENPLREWADVFEEVLDTVIPFCPVDLILLIREYAIPPWLIIYVNNSVDELHVLHFCSYFIAISTVSWFRLQRLIQYQPKVWNQSVSVTWSSSHSGDVSFECFTCDWVYDDVEFGRLQPWSMATCPCKRHKTHYHLNEMFSSGTIIGYTEKRHGKRKKD